MATNAPQGSMPKKQPYDLEKLLSTVWCYYCEKDYGDAKDLISHQKAKHFRCQSPGCFRKLNTAGGLRVHMAQVHKMELTEIENAIDGRQQVDGVEVFAMEGVPEHLINKHRHQLIEGYYRMEAEHRAKTGNPLPSTQKTGAVPNASRTKPDSEVLKARVAAAKAKRAAEKLGQGTGGGTPDAGKDNNPVLGLPNYDPPPVSHSEATNASTTQAVNANANANADADANAIQGPPQLSGYPPFAASPINRQPYQSPAFSPPSRQQQAASTQSNTYGQPPFNFTSGPQHFSAHHLTPPPIAGLPFSTQGMPISTPVMTSHSATGATAAAPPPGNTLPPPTTDLPPRPAFNPPTLSKEDMARMHTGGMSVLQSQNHSNLNTTQEYKDAFNATIDELFISVRNEMAEKANNSRDDSRPKSSSSTGSKRLRAEDMFDNNGGDDDDDTEKPKLKKAKIAPGISNENNKPSAMSASMPVTNGGLPQNHAPGTSNEKDEQSATSTGIPVVTNVLPRHSRDDNGRHEQEPQDLNSGAPQAPTDQTSKKEKKERKEKKHKKGDLQRLVYSDNATSPEERKAKGGRYAFNRKAHEHTEFVQGDVTGAVTAEKGDDTVKDAMD